MVFSLMFYLIFIFLMITNVYASCANQTCIYGRCTAGACHCDPGVKGERCDMDIIDCESNSCLNNSTCMELINGFACQCLPGFYGSRCQYRRKKNEKSCQKNCLNQGKCIMNNNQEKCLCSTNYVGTLCEYHVNQSSSIKKCSILRFQNHEKSGTCLAISLTPLFDANCKCQYDRNNRHFIHCQLLSNPYSSPKCFFKTSLHSPLATTLNHALSVSVCPINWQMLEQYENSQETVRSVRATHCQFN